MRILLLTDDYLPHRGGSRVYYHHLLAHLKKIEAGVLTRQREGDLAFDRAAPYRVFRCPLEEAPQLRSLRLQALPVYSNFFRYGARVSGTFRPDVILAGELVPTGPPAALLARRHGCPLVVFTHAEGPPTIARTRFQSRLARLVCRQADILIAASDNARRGLMEHMQVSSRKIETLLPAVGEAHFENRFAATPLRNPDTPPTLLSVGRLIPRKGFRTVLEALPAILKSIPNLQYIIAGSGPLERDLKHAVERLGVGAHVRFAGHLEDEALLGVFAQSDCFVLPNSDDPETGDTEGFGIVFGEAAAHGLPVVGGRAGGTEHAIRDGETGFRVDGKNPGAVAEAVLRILQTPGLAPALGQAGRAWALAEFRWDTRSARFRQILDSLVRNKNQ